MICSMCKQDCDPDIDFSWKNKDKGLRQSRCKACMSKIIKIHYNANKEIYISRAKINTSKYRKEAKAYVDGVKAHSSCKLCGETHPATLDFHHRDESKKLIEVSKMLGRNSLVKIKAEIAKCDIICSNCHRKLHWHEHMDMM